MYSNSWLSTIYVYMYISIYLPVPIYQPDIEFFTYLNLQLAHDLELSNSCMYIVCRYLSICLSILLSIYLSEFFTYLKLHMADDLLFCYRWLLLGTP